MYCIHVCVVCREAEKNSRKRKWIKSCKPCCSVRSFGSGSCLLRGREEDSSLERNPGSLGEERSGDLFEEVRERERETVREKEELHLHVFLANSY